MKQIWPTYAYSPTTNVLTLTGLNIDRDQLLLVAAPERGRIMYNFADSAVTASAYTAGANTALTLVASTAGLTTTASLVIYYDDQLQSTAITISNFPATQPVSIASVTVGNTVTIAGTVTANPTGTQTITGTVTANVGLNVAQSLIGGLSETNPPAAVRVGWCGEENFNGVGVDNGGAPLPIQIYTGALSSDNVTTANPLPISGTVTIGSALPAGTNRIGVVTIGAGTVTIGAGTAQIGSVTVGNSVTIGSLPAISGTVTAMAGTNFSDEIYQGILEYASGEGGDGTVPLQVNIGTLPAISGTVTANTFALQGTAVTTSNFTSTTASTVLAGYNATREVLTIFNEGAGNLHICAGATCTTIAYQVRLSAGDYYEVPNHQTTITHSAVFATAGTARVTEVS